MPFFSVRALNWRERIESFSRFFFVGIHGWLSFWPQFVTCFFLFSFLMKREFPVEVASWWKMTPQSSAHREHGKWHSGVHLNAKYCDLFKLWEKRHSSGKKRKHGEEKNEQSKKFARTEADPGDRETENKLFCIALGRVHARGEAHFLH